MKRQTGGFVTTIILVIIAFILLKYFFDLAPKQVIDLVWSYIEKPATFAWDRVIWPILNLAWTNLQELLHTGKIAGTPNIPGI